MQSAGCPLHTHSGSCTGYTLRTLIISFPLCITTSWSNEKKACLAKMKVATAPSTPENAPSPPVIRRAFTVPTKLTGISKAAAKAPEADGQGAETLFAHSRCKIVSFNAGTKRPISAGRDQPVNQEPVGTLPWATTTERTIAAGTMIEFMTEQLLTYAYSRTATNLPRPRGVFPQFRHYPTADISEITMLVR